MINVSVIIPTWNRASTIKRAIDSALSQTVLPLEILVCDDGSTDNTFEIVKSLNNPKVKWIAGKHTGLPAVVRNRGIRESKGDWLAFLDSDDWWEKDKLEKQLELVNKLNVEATCSNAKIIKSRSTTNRKVYFVKDQVKDLIGFNNLLATNYVICSSMLVKKQLVLDCGGFPEEPSLKAIEDYALWLRLLTKTNIAYSDKPLVNYLDEPNNSIRKIGTDIKLQRKNILINLSKWATQRFINRKLRLRYLVRIFLEYTKWIMI